MPKVESVVNATRDTVWRIFADPSQWAKWWGGAVTRLEPDWRAGGKVIWATGRPSAIVAIKAGEFVRLEDEWMEHTFRFREHGGTTTVEYEFGPRGGASFLDGGEAHIRNSAACLGRLKSLAESEVTSERKAQGVVNAISPLVSMGLVCPSCQGELIPTNLGHACAAEGKFFNPSLVEVRRGLNSLPFAIIRGKGELSVNISGVTPEFLEIMERQLSTKGFAFALEKEGNSVGFKVRSSALWTYTTVLCQQADGNFKLLFSHRAMGVWLRILLLLLFVIPVLLVAFISGWQMRKNNLRLDWAVLESLQELRKRARSGVKLESPATTEIHGVPAERLVQAALTVMPRIPGKTQSRVRMRFKRFGICMLLAILCAIVGALTNESAKTISKLMVYPFFLLFLIGIYQLVAGLVALIKRKNRTG